MSKNVQNNRIEFSKTQGRVGDLIKLKKSCTVSYGIIIKVQSTWHELSYERPDPYLYQCLVKGKELSLIREAFEIIGD